MSGRNTYSHFWFRTFLGDIDGNVVAREVAFLERQLPAAQFPTVLDLCCGPGRHLAPLVHRERRVIGGDIDMNALVAARGIVDTNASAELIRADMRALPLGTGSLDAVVCMWQSFGHFDDAENRGVLAEIARVLRPGGRVVFDLYHREYHARTQGRRFIERHGLRVAERRWMTGPRLQVELQYEYDATSGAAAATDEFDWRLYTPEEIIIEAERFALLPRTWCTAFDESQSPSAESPRMQIVFEHSPLHETV